MEAEHVRRCLLGAVLMGLAGCSSPSWPEGRFPADVVVERALFSQGSFGMREACEAIVVELTDASAIRLINSDALQQDGWRKSPLVIKQRQHIYARAAFNGCNNDGHRPIGDLEGALERPGSFYKVVNGGEGIAILVPHAKLAGWFYSG